jgi:hypothetical protein
MKVTSTLLLSIEATKLNGVRPRAHGWWTFSRGGPIIRVSGSLIFCRGIGESRIPSLQIPVGSKLVLAEPRSSGVEILTYHCGSRF